MLVACRLLRVTIHLIAGFTIVLIVHHLKPLLREALLRWWARALLRALGVRLRAGAVPPRSAALIVANHVSWLDVVALLAIYPAHFVCKSEVGGWPAIGWLLRQSRTIFIRRHSGRDVWRVNNELRARFAAHEMVAVFPEGTTTDGSEVLPFRPALLQPAVERGLPVCPVAIAYSGPQASYVGDTSFVQSLLSICAARALDVHIAVLPALDTRTLTRREAARRARQAIREALAESVFAPDVSGVLRPA